MHRIYIVGILTLMALFSIQLAQAVVTQETITYIDHLQRNVQHLLHQRSRIEKELEDATQRYYQTLQIVFQAIKSNSQDNKHNLVTKEIIVSVPYDADESSDKLESKIKGIILNHLTWGKSRIVQRDWGAFDLHIMVTLPSNLVPLLEGILSTSLGYYTQYK
jgi:hypothetical protein